MKGGGYYRGFMDWSVMMKLKLDFGIELLWQWALVGMGKGSRVENGWLINF